ncbi:MAG: hypothetical protein BGO69_08120 [Bacteroidetes bacterium 46-16]|nr:MAG: hypothetical protein BGO69_08120 [Bacteroidetes bacterium 46-16]
MVRKNILTGIVLLSLLSPTPRLLAADKSPLENTDKALIKELFLDGLINEQHDARIDCKENLIIINGYTLDEGFYKKYAAMLAASPCFDKDRNEQLIEIKRQAILTVAMADSDILNNWVISAPGGETINRAKSTNVSLPAGSTSTFMNKRMQLAHELIADGIALPNADITISFVNRDATAPINVNAVVLNTAQQQKYYDMLRPIVSLMSHNGHDVKREVKLSIYRFELAKN